MQRMRAMRNNTLIIPGKCLKKGKIYCATLVVPNQNETLVNGIIYNPDCTKSPGAIVEVVEVNPLNNERILLGYTFTNESGEYGFTLSFNPYSVYEFNVYSPLQ